MNNKLTWVHVSDFHFGKNGFDQEFTTKKMLNHISEQSDNGRKPDLIFVTGDIANSGKAEEFKLFNANFVTPLTDILGIDYLDRIFIIPGNHDLNRDVNEGFSKEKFSKADADYFYPTVKSSGKRKMLLDRFEAFSAEIPIDCVKEFAGEGGAFAITRAMSGRDVGIVGINTAWLCDGDSDKASLTPGIQITRAALEKVAQADVKFVLGHHPLDWLHPQHVAPLQAMFADHRIIYLHGHMHTEGVTQSISGSGEYMSIQAGAAWQAPEGGKWKNGLVWGELDFSAASNISLQPFHWSFDNQCWVLDGTRFHGSRRRGDRWIFDAPNGKGNAKIDYNPRKKSPALIGWDVKDLQLLESCTAPLGPEEAISYFDGSTPTWNIALSESVPRREIVNKVAGTFSAGALPLVCAVIGAGCEGKSTALLQASLEILRARPTKKLIWRTNHTRALVPEELIDTLKSHDDWLVVIDEADQVAKDVLRFIDSDYEGYEGKIDFILASRDSDWRSSGASDLAWTFKARYKEITLKDLGASDAEIIVAAWERYGSRGLGEELSNLPKNERAEKLRFYAKKEAKGNSDAFFGALLMCRHGGDLLDHAESMLNKLAAVQLENGKNLKDVLGYIAAMHSEGFTKLTFSALAGILEMSIVRLQSDVIRRLGKEAAATSTSTTVFTRHKYIAAAIVEVLETKFNEDVSRYFIELAVSEVERARREQVLDLAFWRYELSEQLFASGKERLATDITQNLLQADESNYHLLTKLASFYRRQGGAREALLLFRGFSGKPKHRGFYFEWGVCEGNERNLSENALLAIYALSDDSEDASLTVANARMYLSGLAICCDKLYVAFADPLFNESAGAAYSLLSLVWGGTRPGSQKSGDGLDSYLQDVKKNRRRLYGRSASIGTIANMIRSLVQYGVSAEVLQSVNVNSLSFQYLDRIVANVESVRPS
mgnify:CR=1 FL=1